LQFTINQTRPFRRVCCGWYQFKLQAKPEQRKSNSHFKQTVSQANFGVKNALSAATTSSREVLMWLAS